MIRKTLSVCALLAIAAPAGAFQVRALYNQPNQPLLEGAGTQTVTVEVERELNDPQIVCELNVTAAGQQFVNPPPGAATPNEDYTPTSTTLNFVLDVTDTVVSQTFDVPVIDDSLVEPDQDFAAVVTDVQNVDCSLDPTFNIAGESPVPIFDDDTGALSLAVDQSVIAVNEAAGTVDLGITLSGEETIEGAFEVSVAWELVAGSATFPDDYGTASQGSLTFDENTLSQTVTVPIVDDAAIEADEDFTLVLSNPGGTLGADGSALDVGLPASTTSVQILDDDDPGTWQFTNAPYQVDETAGSATVTLSRVGGSAGSLTVYYRAVPGTATAGDDFEQVFGSTTWADGESDDRTFTVPVLDDADVEGDETVLIRAGTDSDFVEFDETTLTIVDDESAATASFATTEASATEDGDTVTLTLVRGGSTTGAVSVDYATEDGAAVAGEDYVAASGTVSWADGDGEDKTITIALLEDTEQEDAEDFQVILSNVTGNATLGGNSVITVTIDASDVTRDISGISTLTPNQRSLANWFDQTCPRLAALESPDTGQQDLLGVCGILRDVDTDDGTVREALDAINPEELMVSSFNALRLTAVQHGNLSQRLNALRSGASGIDLAGLDLEINGQAIAGAALQEMFDGLVGGGASADQATWGRWGGFLNGRIATGDKDASDNESGFDFDLYSVTAGVDYRVRQNLIVGVSGGWGTVDSDYAADGGELDIDSWNAAAYLTYFRDERFYLDALATYGSNDYDSTRRIVFGEGAGAVDRTGRGETDGTQWSFGFGTGWDFNRGGFTFGPHLGSYYYDVEVDAFNETGAGGLDVAIDDQSTQSFTVNAGGHLSYAWLTDWGVLVPNLKVDWVHEFENNSETLAFRFINDPFVGDPSDPSPTITLRSDRPDSNYFIWSVGTSAQFIYGVSGFVNFQSYAGYDNVDISEWSAGLRWEKTW